MTIYEEALADVKKMKEVAEANAKRSILEAVTPRIRNLIESELLRENGDEATDSLSEDEGGDAKDKLLNDIVDASASDPDIADAITPPDAEGKVTLDLDAMQLDQEPNEEASEYELSNESFDALAPVLKASSIGREREFELAVLRTGEDIKRFVAAGSLVRESKGFQTKINEMIQRVEDMYDYVQESLSDPAKGSYETKLESYFKELSKLQESKMSMKKLMNEEDVTLKLTGLPDEIDLDSVGVDLITGDESGDDAEGEDLDVDVGDDAEGSDDSGDSGDSDDLDLGDLDLGGDEGSEDNDEEGMGESRRLSDNTIVEIDSGMLRREIRRMQRLREEAAPSVDGNGVSSKEFDDFGDASSDGNALDVNTLGESDEDLEELELVDEDDMVQVGDRRTRNDKGGSATSVPSVDKSNPGMAAESLRRRARFEARLQERARARAVALKKEAASPRNKNNHRKLALLKREYAAVAKRFNESLKRQNKISTLLAESANLVKGRTNNGRLARTAENQSVKMLRDELAEANLINVKLMFTNKLLQNESLTPRQKAQVIEQLDAAQTSREAKLVYESLSKTLAGPTSKSLNENRDRRVIGSSSRATQPASTPALNEGYEAARWAKLAGIK